MDDKHKVVQVLLWPFQFVELEKMAKEELLSIEEMAKRIVIDGIIPIGDDEANNLIILKTTLGSVSWLDNLNVAELECISTHILPVFNAYCKEVRGMDG